MYYEFATINIFGRHVFQSSLQANTAYRVCQHLMSMAGMRPGRDALVSPGLESFVLRDEDVDSMRP